MQLRAAVDKYQAALELQPGNYDWRLERGQAHLGLGSAQQVGHVMCRPPAGGLLLPP